MPSLTAPSLFADPRVEQAKRLLLQAVAESYGIGTKQAKEQGL